VEERRGDLRKENRGEEPRGDPSSRRLEETRGDSKRLEERRKERRR
jgi:hypothetical protein